MLCKGIIEIIERTYPKQAAMEWDNVGLLVGRTDKEVKKVLTDEQVEKEIARLSESEYVKLAKKEEAELAAGTASSKAE